MDISELEKLEEKCQSGDVDSMYKLAMILRYGKCCDMGFYVYKNRERSNDLLYMAAENGHELSKYLIDDYENETLLRKIGGNVDSALDRIECFIFRIIDNIHFIGEWLLILGIVGVIIWFAIKGIASLPVSIAIILGAIIIAIAVIVRK